MKVYVCKYIQVFEILYFPEKHGTDVGVPRQPYRTSLSEPSMATQQLAPQVFKSLPSSPSFDQNVAEHAAPVCNSMIYRLKDDINIVNTILNTIMLYHFSFPRNITINILPQ